MHHLNKSTPHFARGVVGMIASNLAFSLMAILIRVNPGLNGFQTSFFRFLIGAAIIVSMALLGFTKLDFKDKWGLIGRGLFGGLSVVLYYVPINYIGLGKTSVINYTYPFFAMLFSSVFLKERSAAAVWALMGMALSGLVLLNMPDLVTGGWNWMILLAWASAVCAGVAVMMVKRLTATESSSSIFLSQCLGGFWIVLLPAHAQSIPSGMSVILLLIAIGVAAAVGQLIMTWSYRHLDVATGSLLSCMTPVLNIVAGVALFGEHFTALEVAGMTVTLLACVLLVFAKRPVSRQSE